MRKSKSKRKVVVIAQHCVSCGACIKECPLGALSIRNGVIAEVDGDKCVGCGKCAAVCPANAITVVKREVQHA